MLFLVIPTVLLRLFVLLFLYFKLNFGTILSIIYHVEILGRLYMLLFELGIDFYSLLVCFNELVFLISGGNLIYSYLNSLRFLVFFILGSMIGVNYLVS